MDRPLGLADDYITAKWNLQSTERERERERERFIRNNSPREREREILLGTTVHK